MHAIVCHEHGGLDVMQYAEVPRPEPGNGELLIETEAVGVNFVDTMRRSGRHPTAPEAPFTPGIELCGRVAALGNGVTRFREGDRVIGRCVTHGAYAEYVPVEERFASPCPEGMSAAEAAALFVNGQTAYHALISVGRLQRGESVLITAAAGGVGTCAVQIGRLLEAQVLAAAGSPEKRELAQRLGADVTIDYTREGWPQEACDATGGSGADLVLESVGGAVARGCIECWARGGRIVIFGKASGEPAVVTGDDLLFGSRTAYGLAVGTLIDDEAVMREAMEKLLAWWEAGQLALQIGATYPLREAAQAHRDLENRRTQGKLILVP